jgi:type I restriction enzyme, S subunit
MVSDLIMSHTIGMMAPAGMGAKHVNVKDIRQSLIPLPPLPEQAAIVAQVERLLGLFGQLEAEAAGQRVQAEGLLQAALREAMGA